MKRERSSQNEPDAATSPGQGTTFPVVGIGASAGGLEAFSELLGNLPVDSGMAFVLIQHMAADAASVLPELLERTTSIPVLEVTQGVELERDRIYVLTPAKDVVLSRGRLRLVDRKHARGVHLPIDHFFRSLASEQGRRAIGVVLSGAASDGTAGLQEIKASGGITFAQDPATARYDGMPRSAIAAGCVDMVRSPEGIATELGRLGAHPYLLEPEPVQADTSEEQCYATILDRLKKAFGVDFSEYKMSTVRRRIARRMAVHRLTVLAEYVAYLDGDPDEIDALYHDILIMVTHFRRDQHAFSALRREVYPRLTDGKPAGAPIRIWVPGCSTGEEAYSIVMDLADYLTGNDLDHPVKLFASDINERDIAHARRGLYTHSRLANVPPEWLHRYFSQVQDGFEVRETIRDACVFARHDVTRDTPFSHIDLISCRNLLIYLSVPLQEKVLAMLHYALRPRGILTLGGAETVGAAKDLFATVDAKHRIYERTEAKPRIPSEFAYPQAVARRIEIPDSESRAPNALSRPFDPLKMADSLVMNRHTPPGVVIDDAFNILQFRGNTDSYLRHGSGPPTLNLLSMAREGLEGAVRRAVAAARKSDAPAVRTPASVGAADGPRKVDVVVERMTGPDGRLHFLILFVPTDTDATQHPAAAPRRKDDDQMLILRSELDASREHLRSLVAEKDIVVEELRAANEEIQSSNEELQSINEELETAKEELQSTNEELLTVNEELEVRNTQLTLTNDDLSNLLQSMHIPVLMVDRELRLRRATPEAQRLISMTPADVGRSVDDFHLRLEIADLPEILRAVIDTMTPAEHDVLADDGRWYSLRVRPYQTRDAHIAGAIITLLDIDALRRSLDEVADYARLSAGITAVTEALRATPEQPRSLDRALAAAAEAEGADSASLVLRNAGLWQTGAGFGLTDQDVGQDFTDSEFPHASLAAAARSAVAISHVAEDSRVPIESVRRLRLRSLLAAPILVDDEVKAVLLFNWHDSPVQLSDSQTDFADKVAALLGLALEAGAAPPSG
jgi:two-component system CheB/CheR fusion protein